MMSERMRNTRGEFVKKRRPGAEAEEEKLRKQTKRVPTKTGLFLSRNDDTVADDDFP